MAADPRERRREGSRRAVAARAKREEARQKRRTRNLLLGGGGIVALIALVTALVVFTGAPTGPGRVVNEQTGTHFAVGSIPLEVYNTQPPSSGPHYNHWSPWGFLGEPLVVGEVVHSMEHGGVIIWYQPGDPELAGQVRDLVRGLGSQCIVAGSHEHMPWRVAATAWGRILELNEFDAEQLREFAETYRGRLGPEAGACVTNP